MNEVYENGEYLLDMARYDISRLVQKMFYSGDDRITIAASWNDIRSEVSKLYKTLLKHKEHAVPSATRAEICGGYTIYHSINVSILSMYIAILMDKEEDDIINIGIAGLLHDVGKKYISTPVIEKRGPLSKQEQDIFKMHPKLGYNLIKHKYPEAPKEVLRGIRDHHERVTGSGYPEGKKKICETARIIAIADSFEAFTAVRPYHSSRPLTQGFKFILNEEGLDHDIAEVFAASYIIEAA